MRGETYTPYPTVDVPGTPPSDYQSIPTRPGQFGAQVGQGAQEFGAGALKVSDVYGTLAAEQAATEYQREADKILHGDPDTPGDIGFYGLKGQAAMDARQDTVQRLNELQQKHAGTLWTAHSQTIFHGETRHLASRLSAEIGRHADQQANAWAATVNKDRFENAVASAARRPEDEDYATQMLGQANSSLVKQGQFDGALPTDPSKLSDDQAAHMTALQRHASTAIAEARIKALLPTNPGAAARLLEQSRSTLMASGHYDALSNAVRAKAGQADGDALANGALGLSPMPAPSGIGRGMGASPMSAGGDLWGRIKGAEGGLGRGGEALVSPKGAIGISQIIPSTAREMATDLGLSYDERRLHTDQAYNEKLGKGYLDKMLGRYGGNEALAAAAYNAGPDRVDTWLRTIGDPTKGELTDAEFAGRIPFGETRAYVQRIIAGSPREAVGAGSTAGVGFDLSAGDSIGVGLSRHGGLGGVAVNDVKMPEAATADAAGGRNPQQALDYIQTHPDRFAGKAVLWSSGLMNAADPKAALAKVGEQLDALKATGARVVLVGVDTGKFGQYNTALGAIAEEKGVPFAGPLPTNDVHPGPQGYKQYAANAVKLIPPGTMAQGAPPDQMARPSQPEMAQPSGPNRTGLPPLSEVWNRVWNTPGFSDDARSHAWQKATTRYNALEADAARSERIATQRQHQALEHRTNEIWADIYGPNPKITAQQIAVDPAFDGNPERRKAMIELVNNPPGSGVPAAQSYNAALSLVDRIRLPEGDANKITSEDQIYEQMRSLNRPDLEFVLKKYNDIRSPGGEKYAQREAQFIKGISAQIDKSNPLLGTIDETGKQKLYEFQWELDQKVEQYRKAGKDPNDLLNPAKPEYMGKPEALSPFQKTMEESAADVAKKYAAPAKTAPLAAPEFAGPAGSTPVRGGISIPLSPIVPREPGETPDDYLRRIGRGVMPAR